MKIKKGDKIIVIKGKDKGKTGEVIKSIPSKLSVVVKGVCVRTVHQRARQKGEKGALVKKEMPINISNVSLFDSKTKKPTKTKWEVKDNKKIRVPRKSDVKI
ncbi:MAG: 50S ribosomal protein L24 [Candidatus Campbellbacteria bacterium]|nr:50S ribosomal protein L24 [Candidatus Campbellbacteria bacterium]